MPGAISILRLPVTQEYRDAHPSMEESMERAINVKNNKGKKEPTPKKKPKKAG